MSEHVNRLLVVLEQDVRSEDIAQIVAAISQYRNVLSVTPVFRDNGEAFVARARAVADIHTAVYDMLGKLR